jgi:hypothetical protein
MGRIVGSYRFHRLLGFTKSIVSRHYLVESSCVSYRSVLEIS